MDAGRQQDSVSTDIRVDGRLVRDRVCGLSVGAGVIMSGEECQYDSGEAHSEAART